MLRFLADHNIKPDDVSVQERAKLADALSNGNRVPADTLATTSFYRVRWTECRELVRSRRVLLHRGYCYVTVADLIQFVAQKFRAILNISMNVSKRALIKMHINNFYFLETTPAPLRTQ